MGSPMAANLVSAGHAVAVWNRTAQKARALADRGARVAASPRECATGAEVVFLCLADERAVIAVLEGREGVLAGLAPGSVLVDTSTAGPGSAGSVDVLVRSVRARFVAAPLLGSRLAAERRELTVVAGGPLAAREQVRPLLAALSSRVIELETAPQAALMKLVVNCLGGAMITGFGEALTLGAKGGLSLPQMIDAIGSSAFRSPLYESKGRQLVENDLAPRFTLALAEKDERLVQETAAGTGVTLPVNAAVRRLLAEGVASGRGELDLCAIAELLFERAGVKR
jgi:3-hydroxyisobutyrate dehydrogenase-like beta-hydroxyacid dehydrogenase